MLTLAACKKRLQEKVHEKGLGYVLWHLVKKVISFETLIVYPLVFVLCIIIHLIKPILFIRFGSLHCEKIGPFSGHPVLNICEQEHGIQPGKTFNIYCQGVSSYVCNNQLLAMWKRVLRVYPGSRYFWRVMSMFSFGKDHTIQPTNDGHDVHGLLEKSDVQLKFLPEEIDQAKQEMKRMGIGEEDEYVLMINRGQRYLEEALPGEMDYSYHTYRNWSIEDLMPMAEELTSKGYFAIRMGHLVSDIMKTDNPRIIEYDHKGFRTELLDIYLGANCRYIVGADTGYCAVPSYLFRRPMVLVNFSNVAVIPVWLQNWLIIPKKYWLKTEKRFMKIKEVMESGLGKSCFTEEFEKRGIEVINNTPEEILEVVEEMEERLDGIWQDNEGDSELQRQFWSHYEKSDLHGVINSRIGTKFLRQNKDLLY